MSRNGRRGRAWRFLAAAALLAAGCAGVPRPAAGLLEVADLEGSPAEAGPEAAKRLLREGDAAWERRDEPVGPGRARLAYWRAAAADPTLYDAYWKAARASIPVGEGAVDGRARSTAFERGARTAQLAIDLDPARAEAHYYYALNLGLLARERPTTGIESIKTMIPHLEQALAEDPGFDQAGAQRTLALVYLRAPGWPTSVGDEEAGLEHARLAVAAAPGYPMNQVVLAEALIANGLDDEAREAIARARELLASGEWRAAERREATAAADRLSSTLR
jgi:hypothetical protein